VGQPRSVSIGATRRSIHLVRTEDFNYIESLVDKVIGKNSSV
jgi:hypothetical protein